MSNSSSKYKVLRAQPGPQTKFLSSSADVIVFGGGAGGGKTFAVLLDILRYSQDPNFTAVVFRRTSPMITSPGSIWQTSKEMFRQRGIDADPLEGKLTMRFPNGGVVKYTHMEHESDKLSHAGAQYTGIYFDEGQHFLESQVQFMFSRMRSDAESSSYMRITCNPDPDCYLREWIDWWLDKDGFPDKEKGGVIRWFVIRNNTMEWGDTPQELAERLQEPDILANNEALSFTYIPALATDNPAMVKNNPKYISFLKGLPRIERAALLEGNWNVKLEAGTYFNRSWVDNTSRQWPTNLRMDTLVRYWDRAATAVSEAHKDPDWTVGVLMGRDGSNNYWVLDVQRMRGRPYDVKKFIKQTAVEDGHHVTQILEQDPGAAGKSEVDDTSNMLIVSGYACRARKVNKDKLTRFKPFSAASEQGRVYVVKKSWNEAFFSELENFTGERDDRAHDDQVDAISGAFSEINTGFQTPSGLRLGTVKNTNLFSNFNL